MAVLIGAATWLAGLAPLGAQAAPPSTDSLLRRVQTLDSAFTTQFRVLDSVRRSLVSAVPAVTVRVGPVSVRTTPELEPRVRRAAESVAKLVAASGDSVVIASVAARTSVVTPDSARGRLGMVRAIRLQADTGRAWATARSRAPATATAPDLAGHLAAFAERSALEAADSALSAWVMVGRVPLRQPTDAELSDAFLELATVGSEALRRCQRGDVASCLDVLGIDSLPGTRLDRWYAETDYRALLHHVAPPGDDSTAVAAWIRCRRAGDLAGCGAAARALPPNRIPVPLSAALRSIFLRTVLDAGGPGAYDRLVASRGTLDARLARAAGQPLPVVTRQWLARLEQARPARMPVTPSLVLASLGWCGALIAVALARRGSWT